MIKKQRSCIAWSLFFYHHTEQDSCAVYKPFRVKNHEKSAYPLRDFLLIENNE